MDRARYLELIEPAIAVVIKKHEDYNQGAVTLDAYFPFGDYSYVQMLHVKILRLVSLCSQDPTTKPNYESIEDTLLDLLNYTVFYLDFIRRNNV